MSTANELRQLKVEELRGRAAELKQQLFDLRTKHATGILDSTAQLAETRRQIARCLTVAREQDLGLKRQAKEPVKPSAAKADKPAKKSKKKE